MHLVDLNKKYKESMPKMKVNFKSIDNEFVYSFSHNMCHWLIVVFKLIYHFYIMWIYKRNNISWDITDYNNIH